MIYKRITRNVIIILVIIWLTGPGWQIHRAVEDHARKYTRPLEFDYFTWTLDTLWTKAIHRSPDQMGTIEAKNSVTHYLQLVGQFQSTQNQINSIYIDPNITNPKSASEQLSYALSRDRKELERLTPEVESVLQYWVHQTLKQNSIATLAIVFPPVQYHTSDVPLSLFLSPREKIELIANISLQPTLTTEERVRLEQQIESDWGVSALVEPVGGLGTYPTMIMMTTDLNWLVETITHEWVHNYLFLHPLGMHYDASPEVRTMNETVANLVGKEIGRQVIKEYYPELVPDPAEMQVSPQEPPAAPPSFNFQDEMRQTRIETDRLLSLGKFDQAESYMEARRRLFWEHGYLIRRINQAYFAFYGAYNDAPGGGASGDDPVGPAVQRYKQEFSTLGDFLKAIARLDSYAQLLEELETR